MKREIERLALASHRATERHHALSMQNTATEPADREKQAVAYALATAEMFETRGALLAAVMDANRPDDAAAGRERCEPLEIPAEITEAAHKLENWFASQGCHSWALMGVCSRNHAQR